ncbi:hypothetical protein PF002_g11694 [Phytophthora fragariae]|nr:hypothetical protein PF009_g18992 [Phytophthora fragariae]KAE9234798.1 hypothetical protein PF002_g11694 [Phytophthora fragariae]
MERKVGNMMNDHAADVAELFAEELVMDLEEPDIDARVSKYFIDFDRLVDTSTASDVAANKNSLQASHEQMTSTTREVLPRAIKPSEQCSRGFSIRPHNHF